MDLKTICRQWLDSGELTKEESFTLEQIMSDDKALAEHFAASLEFGTAGMRGVLGPGPNRMNMQTVKRATKGLAEFLKSAGAARDGIVISYDTRRMSAEFAIAAAKVLAYFGVKAYLMEDVRPVPMCSFAIRTLRAAGGIMITASHNPKQYNGYKVYGGDGAQLSPEATEKVVGFIEKSDYFGIPELEVKITPSDIKGQDGYKIAENIEIIGKTLDEAYFAELKKLSLADQAAKDCAKKIKIVYTPLHGSGRMPVIEILKSMGITPAVVGRQEFPDPDFSTVPVPNPEDSAALKLAVGLAKEIGADIVLGTDPDCDRMGVAVRGLDGGFSLLNGNQIGVLLTDYILSRNLARGTLPKNAAIVKTIVTTALVDKVAASYGAAVFDVLTGFKFIGEKIKEWEENGEHTFMFGFEESYGFLSGTHARDKDAVVACMLFSEMECFYKSRGTSVAARLNEIYGKFGYFFEKSVSVVYGGLDGMSRMKAIMEKLRATKIEEVAGFKAAAVSDFLARVTTFSPGARQAITLPKTNAIKIILENGDWLCVRPSGTEPKLKIYASASALSMPEAAQKADVYLSTLSSLCSSDK